MTTWNQDNLHKHMIVYSSDKQKLGHVADIYEDSFLVHEGFLFTHDKYIPYSAIAQIDHEDITLNLTANEASEKKWATRPDYEDHLGDPTQLFYDRGHGIHDPFDEVNPNS
jgi:hypothetical protein